MRRLLTFFVVLILGGLSACNSLPDNALTEAPDQQTSNILKDYSIGIGDTLSINVWKNPELSLDVPVRPDGKISMPLIGEIKAFGLNPQALTEELQSALSNFIRNPQVTVVVTNAASADFQNRVRITGAVEQPLSLPHRSGMTILDLVLEAGGLNDFAVGNKAVLYRKSVGGMKSYRIKLGDILRKGKLSTNYELLPSDVLIVPERSI